MVKHSKHLLAGRDFSLAIQSMYLLAGCNLVLSPHLTKLKIQILHVVVLGSPQPPPSDTKIYEHKLIGGLGRLYKVHACAFAAPFTETSMSCRGILIRSTNGIEHFFRPLTQKLSASLHPSAFLHLFPSIFKTWFDFFRLSISNSWSNFCFPAELLFFKDIYLDPSAQHHASYIS